MFTTLIRRDFNGINSRRRSAWRNDRSRCGCRTIEKGDCAQSWSTRIRMSSVLKRFVKCCGSRFSRIARKMPIIRSKFIACMPLSQKSDRRSMTNNRMWSPQKDSYCLSSFWIRLRITGISVYKSLLTTIQSTVRLRRDNVSVRQRQKMSGNRNSPKRSCKVLTSIPINRKT